MVPICIRLYTFIFKPNLNIFFTCVAIYVHTQNMYNSMYNTGSSYHKKLKYIDFDLFFKVFPEALEVRIVLVVFRISYS